ncbi:MAG: general secretion pathway protein GspK [Deltaproteobacteria bacterium]|nr:general secretion pathway protein GspK [Deltaproteobacteria bacterium]
MKYSQRGVVLLVVTSLFLVLSFIYAMFLLKAYHASLTISEYINSNKALLQLNSALNFAEQLLMEDNSREIDYHNDLWIPFRKSANLSQFFARNDLKLSEEGCELKLQIIPSEGKIPLNSVVPLTSVIQERAEMLIRLFRLLGFDNDGQVWFDDKGREFALDSCKTVASLVDFIDYDNSSVKLDECDGFESEYGYELFGNFKPTDFNELLSVPGFTADRIVRIMPFVRLSELNPTNIDINSAPDLVIRALVPQIDSIDLKNILEFRVSLDGPFNQFQKLKQLEQLIANQEIAQKLSNSTTTETKIFEMYAEYRCGNQLFMARGIADIARLGYAVRINKVNSVRVFIK